MNPLTWPRETWIVVAGVLVILWFLDLGWWGVPLAFCANLIGWFIVGFVRGAITSRDGAE